MFRQHGRTAIRCPMMLRHKRLGVVEAVTRDISSSGIFIGFVASEHENLISQVKLGDELEARLECPNDENETLILRVARLAQDGVALTFG